MKETTTKRSRKVNHNQRRVTTMMPDLAPYCARQTNTGSLNFMKKSCKQKKYCWTCSVIEKYEIKVKFPKISRLFAYLTIDHETS